MKKKAKNVTSKPNADVNLTSDEFLNTLGPDPDADRVRASLRRSGERWLRDFGECEIVDYDTGKSLGTARKYVQKHGI